MYNKLIQLPKTMKDFVIKLNDRREERPRGQGEMFFFLVGVVISLLLILWIEFWLPSVNIESARWALSAQAQATAAILGLLIAAMAFRWRAVSNQEQQLRSNIFSYLKKIASSTIDPQNIIYTVDVAYDTYLKWIRQNERERQPIANTAYVNLGRLWVIKQLSSVYRVRIKFGRFLTHSQTRELDKVNKLSKEAAITMWENYYRYPANFILDMNETLDGVWSILTGLDIISRQEDKKEEKKDNAFHNKYAIFQEITLSILTDDSKVIAEEIKLRRTALMPFFFACVTLTFAIVFGLLGLSGINSENTLLAGQNLIRWVVGIPIALSAYGISLCLLFIRRIWS